MWIYRWQKKLDTGRDECPIKWRQMVTADVVDFPKKKSFGFVFSWCWCRFKNYIEFAAGSIPTSTLADCRAQPARAWPLWPNQIRPKPFSALETVYLTAYFCLEKQPSLTSRSKIFSCESSRKSEPPFSLGWMTCFWLSHGLWMTLGHNTGG